MKQNVSQKLQGSTKKKSRYNPGGIDSPPQASTAMSVFPSVMQPSSLQFSPRLHHVGGPGNELSIDSLMQQQKLHNSSNETFMVQTQISSSSHEELPLSQRHANNMSKNMQGNQSQVRALRGINRTTNELTESQQQLLQTQRENMRNFLPAIYNSVNLQQQEILTARKRQEKSPSLDCFKDFIQPVYNLNSGKTLNSPLGNQVNRQESTEMTNQSGISHEGGKLTISNSQDLTINENGPTSPATQEKTARDYYQNQQLNTESGMDINSQTEEEGGAYLASTTNNINDWINDGIKDASYRPHEHARNHQHYQTSTMTQRLRGTFHQKDIAKQTRNEPTSTQHNSLYSSRNELPDFKVDLKSTWRPREGSTTQQEIGESKRYVSSDIFALKKIQAEQSQAELIRHVGATSNKNVHKRKERLLVKSLDLSTYLQSNRHMNRSSRFANPALMHSQDFSSTSNKQQLSALLNKGKHASMTNMNIVDNRQKKNFIIAPINQPINQPLGVADRGDSVCQTLIGQMPQGTRQIQAETVKTFSPLRKATQANNERGLSTDLQGSAQMFSRSSLPPETSISQLKQNIHTRSNHLSDMAGISHSVPGSPMLHKKNASGRLLNKQGLIQDQQRPYHMEQILKTDGHEEQTPAYAFVGSPDQTRREIDAESPLIFQGYSTMQLAPSLSGNVSQSLLLNPANQQQNQIMAADLASKLENRVTTAAKVGELEDSQFGAHITPAKVSQGDVTSELYSQFEMEVLRKKIEKRITMQQNQEKESEAQKKTFAPELEKQQKGPFRLNMETSSRKTVMKILQDNKQKLSQTRQEIIDTIKQERARMNTEALSTFNEAASATISATHYDTVGPTMNSHVTSVDGRKTKSKHITDDQVLQSVVYERLASGMPAMVRGNDIMSRMSQITDEQSHGLYHQRLVKNQAKQESKRNSIMSQLQSLPTQRFGIQVSHASLAMPDYMIKSQTESQSDRDRAAAARLLLYQVDQIEQEALLKEQDEETLHGLLKYKLRQYIKQRYDGPQIDTLYRYQPKPPKLTPQQEEEARQKHYHKLAATFRNWKENGRLMTRKSMANLLEKLEQSQKNMIAANQPMYGEISFDRAINEMMDHGPVPWDPDFHSQKKGLALLKRYESIRQKEEQEQEQLQAMCLNFIQKLLCESELPNPAAFNYEFTSDMEPKSAYTKAMTYARNKKSLLEPPTPLLKANASLLLPKFDMSMRKGSIGGGGSPTKLDRASRKQTLIMQTKQNIRVQKSRPRKTNLTGFRKMRKLREKASEKERLPLKHLSEDLTDEFNHNQIATKIFELIQFYKVHKDSISQVYREKYSQDSRLAYLLECMQAMELILPILDKVQPDGTLYLKEYTIKEGQSKGLAIACRLNECLCQKVFIDNCGLQELDTARLLEGFIELNTLRALVLRRTAICTESIPHLAHFMVKIFPNNLNILKIEKCQISKEATFDLVTTMREKCYVRVLSLVGVNFDEESIQVFCEFLMKKNHLEELDVSDNRLKPKAFFPILEAISTMKQLKTLNISWNILLTEAKPPQIGTYVKEEDIVYGRADEPIEFPPTPRASESADEIGGDDMMELPQPRVSSNALKQPTEPMSPNGQNRPPRLDIEKINQRNQSALGMTADEEPRTSMKAASPTKQQQVQSSVDFKTALDFNKSQVSQNKFRTSQTTFAGESTKSKKQKNQEQEDVNNCLYKIIKSNQLQHLDMSDCGLTESMILMLVGNLDDNPALLSLHLTGNPGLKDAVIEDIQKKLKATYETPILKQTFKPLIRLYDNKYGQQATSQAKPQPNTVRESILKDIEEREQSLSSASLYDYSDKNYIPPERLREQIQYKNFMREKELLLPIDDGKVSRDHKRHFCISRQLGADLLTPGASEWQLMKDSAQECWVCDRKQFVFFFWSPEFSSQSCFTANWLNEQDKNKILEVVLHDRETSILRENRRLQVDEQLKSPRNPHEIEEQKSEDVSESIVSSDREVDSMTISSELRTARMFQDEAEATTVRTKVKRPFYLDPMIYGSFNNWQPQPMIRVSHLARALDKRPAPDFLQKCKEMKLCREWIQDIKEMKPTELRNYQEQIRKFWDSFESSDVWGPIIAEFLKTKFKQTRIIGRENFELLQPKKIWVTAAYMDMGKNNYIVTMGSQTYFHETKVSFRREPLPVQNKFRGDAVVKDREANVFKFWVQDTREQLSKVYDLDFGYSKIGSIIKGPINQEELKNFMLQPGHFDLLKDVFLTLTLSSGNFPYLNSQDFTRFCKEIKLTDKNINQSRIDTIISNVKASKGIDKPKFHNQGALDLSRPEFFEALIRVSIAKFKENAPNPQVVSQQDAVEAMMNEKLKPNFTPAPWQVFRDEELWTQKVNLVFHDNEEGLRKVFAKYAKPGLNKIPYEKAVKLLTTDCSIRLDKFDAIYCYGMSLSTCTDLNKLMQNKMLHMSYEEFLEMLGRAADVHFQGSDVQSIELWEKIMLILDELCQMVEDWQPIIPEWTTVIYEPGEGESSKAELYKLKTIKMPQKRR